METFLDRLKKERTELFGRVEKLKLFLVSGDTSKIPTTQLELMKVQLNAMEIYLYTLDERLDLLNKESNK